MEVNEIAEQIHNSLLFILLLQKDTWANEYRAVYVLFSDRQIQVFLVFSAGMNSWIFRSTFSYAPPTFYKKSQFF